MKRAFVWLATGAIVLVALYAGAGYWLAPGLIRNALGYRAGAAGLDLRVEAIRTHPFVLSLELYASSFARAAECRRDAEGASPSSDPDPRAL